MYVGKSIRPFAQRMHGYAAPGPTQRTNIRVRQLLLALHPADESCDIYIWTSRAPLNYGEFPINLAAGLECTLIGALRPPWNIGEKNGGRRGERLEPESR